ncbi:MAG: ABC transporter substrate-binding protein [Peptococcaceae bacterium]
MLNHRKCMTICTLLLLLCLTLTGCGGNQAAESQDTQQAPQTVEDGAYTFTDALGQEITVDHPQRVVSLMGSFSEIWVLAGGFDTLVGTSADTVDNRDLGLPEDIAIVGTYQDPNIEEILALEPDLVLLSAETTRTDSHVALKDALSEAGITAAYFSVTHFEDYLNMLKICSDITGDADAYQKNGLDVEAQIETILAENKLDTEPSVLLMVTYSGGIRAQSSDTMTGRMLAELGCHNILDDNPGMLQDFSVENIIEADPDYIFVIPMGNDDALAEKNLKENVESNPAWSSLTAVKEGRYILLPKDKFMYKPNARWAESYAYLADLLHA